MNGRPLADVTVQMGTITAKTDAQGEFLLANIPAGYNKLLIVDGIKGTHTLFESTRQARIVLQE